MADPRVPAVPGTNEQTSALAETSRSKATKVMMDQQNFEATRPVSADPAVALAEALGQLPKAPVKGRAAKPDVKAVLAAKTSVEELASELGLTLGDQNELTIRRI